MNVYKKTIIVLISGLIMSSCGAIPTLPPLDSTVIIRTPIITINPPAVTQTDVGLKPTATSPHLFIDPTPSKTQPTSPTQPKPTNTPRVVVESPTTAPSATATPTATATDKPKPTATRTPVPYKLQLLNPYYLSNFTHADLGCAWMGVAGQIFDSEGVVQKEILVKAGGDILGTPIVEEMTLPLAESEIDLAYGPGGYEITLAYSPADTENTVWIQLYDLAGKPLSEKIYLTTYDDCLKT